MYHVYGDVTHYAKETMNFLIKNKDKREDKCWAKFNLIIIRSQYFCVSDWLILYNQLVLTEYGQPAKQAYFAVRSIWTFDGPRVGASQKK